MKNCFYVKNVTKYKISGKNWKILGKNKKTEKIQKNSEKFRHFREKSNKNAIFFNACYDIKKFGPYFLKENRYLVVLKFFVKTGWSL